MLWFRRADHSMIYVLIAGTYTPLCLIALPRIWGIPMLVVAWVTALAGVILKMVRLGVGDKSSGSWLYIVMGWGAVITLPVLVTSLDVAQLVLLGVGGVLYTVGAVILGRKRPDPSPDPLRLPRGLALHDHRCRWLSLRARSPPCSESAALSLRSGRRQIGSARGPKSSQSGSCAPPSTRSGSIGPRTRSSVSSSRWAWSWPACTSSSAVSTAAASAVVIGTARIRPIEPTSMRTTSTATISLVMMRPLDFAPWLNSSTSGSVAPA